MAAQPRSHRPGGSGSRSRTKSAKLPRRTSQKCRIRNYGKLRLTPQGLLWVERARAFVARQLRVPCRCGLRCACLCLCDARHQPRDTNLTPFPRRGGRTFPDRERRARNSLKSPHNSREWLPGRRGVAAVRLRRRPGYGSRPELFWPWPAKGAASAPLKPPQASASRHGVWLNQPPPLLERPSR